MPGIASTAIKSKELFLCGWTNDRGFCNTHSLRKLVKGDRQQWSAKRFSLGSRTTVFLRSFSGGTLVFAFVIIDGYPLSDDDVTKTDSNPVFTLIVNNYIWLVASLPLWKIRLRQLGLSFWIYGTNKYAKPPSIDWLKGKITGNSHSSCENLWFHVDFPFFVKPLTPTKSWSVSLGTLRHKYL